MQPALALELPRIHYMPGFLQDLRYGARVLLKSPGATAVALLAMAFGIGVNLSSFASLNAMVLHPLPFPHLERIMTVWETLAKSHDERYPVAPANFLDLAKRSRSFEQIAAYRNWAANLTGTGDPTRVTAALVSPSFFTVLGMRPVLGRTFNADEAEGAHPRVAVVSDRFWHKYLAGSPHAVGKLLVLNGAAYTVVGVMPSDFDFPLTNDLWAPLSLSIADEARRADHTLNVIALLKPDVSVEKARGEVRRIAARLERQNPETNESRGLGVVPLRELTDDVTGRFVLILLASSVLTLLLACANVANLQLARAVTRGKEIALRAAMGASSFQIARQIFAETLLLAAVGSVLALLLESWNLSFTKATIPPAVFAFVAGLRTMHIDGYVLLYTLGISLLTAALCALPAVIQLLRQRSRTDLNETLKEGGRTTGIGAGRNRLQSTLVLYEISMALVLLIGAGLLVKMFEGFVNRYYGYDPKNVLQFQVSLPPADYPTDAQLINFYDRLLRQFQSLPAAQVAAVRIRGTDARLSIEGRPEARPGDPQPELEAVSPGLLSSMRIPLVEGRFLSDRDRPESAPVAVISQSVAHYYWPGSDPVGHRIKLGDYNSRWLTIVGVCGNVVDDWFGGRPSLTAYVPYTQHPDRNAEFLIRTFGNPAHIAGAARAAARQVDRDLPLYAVKTMENGLLEQTAGIRSAAQAMSTYAVVALLLAATGIFAIVSFFVAQRTRDIGVRMALGAQSSDVLKLTLAGTLRLTFQGLLMGALIAFGFMRFVSSMLYHVVQLDGTTFAACAVLLALAALLASYLPAYRATRIDPLIALRQE